MMMRRFLSALTMSLCVGFTAHAQVYIFNENMLKERMSEIKTTVLDSLTNEPVSYASVYVIPAKDTTITNFTLTDANGEAKLDEVPFGSYAFHVEMMGYKPVVLERFFREEKVDLGTIRLQVDEQFLQAAVVTDVGNPIVVKKDTVEFNASSFRVGANAMLKDLLQRMPGMEITDDGKVKFNGEEIDKLTVGGRTFFFGDQSTALNNLPAAVVDKIRVIDRESEQTRASGIQDGSREKVLDVGLKKEYEKGWFGNVGVKGGTTIGGQDGDNPLQDDRGLLWGGNALVSAYTEKDQLTVIANGQNVDDSNVVIIVSDDEGQRSSLDQGLSTAAQLGVNYNTSRIKDVETTVSANYKYTDTDSGSQTERTTFQDDGNLNSSTENSGKQFVSALNTNVEFKKEKGKVWFHFTPSFRCNRVDETGTGSSETFRTGTFVNGSEKITRRLSSSNNTGLNADITFRELWGKKNRNLRLDINGNYGGIDEESDESSVLKTAAGVNAYALHYLLDSKSYGFGGSAQWTEPISEKWTLSASAELGWAKYNNNRDAFDANGRNDYYSSVSNNHYLTQLYGVTAQYKFGEDSWFTLGGRVSGILNETYSKSFGIEDYTGKGQLDWFVTPNIRFQYSKGNDRISLYASGYGRRPNSSRMLPVLNISDPSRLSLGNVYLKPYTTTNFGGNWKRDNKKRFSTLMVYVDGTLNTSPVSFARWYDTDGILYSIPVNSQKPSVTASLTANYTTPLDAKKNWSLTLNGVMAYTSSVSYQAKTTLPGLDKDAFDYSAFMADFWGNADGDRFYGGLSGFGESRTRSFNPYAGFTVKYNQDHYFISLEANTQGRIARYSLDPSINMNTLDTKITARGSYTTKHEFEFNTDISYVFYKGYAAGYGDPEWRWYASVSKNIGAFNLSVKVYDILNQTRRLTHTVTANYEEDSYRLCMGRYILFGVKWNFGKMNAIHSARAQQAAWNMLF